MALNLVLALQPPSGGCQVRTGQFAFVTFNTMEGAHPFTIASADQGNGTVTFPIKSLGDFTRNAGQDPMVELLRDLCQDFSGMHLQIHDSSKGEVLSAENLAAGEQSTAGAYWGGCRVADSYCHRYEIKASQSMLIF